MVHDAEERGYEAGFRDGLNRLKSWCHGEEDDFTRGYCRGYQDAQHHNNAQNHCILL